MHEATLSFTILALCEVPSYIYTQHSITIDTAYVGTVENYGKMVKNVAHFCEIAKIMGVYIAANLLDLWFPIPEKYTF